MAMLEIPKSVNKQLKKLVATAYERELRQELERLAQQFDAWRTGRIGTWEIDSLIHKYHNGSARELWKLYDSSASPRLLVASALVRRIIAREEIPDQVWPYIEGLESLFEGPDADESGDDTTDEELT